MGPLYNKTDIFSAFCGDLPQDKLRMQTLAHFTIFHKTS